MLSERLYYVVKPYMPWGMRMALRRVWARRKRRAFGAVWPIDPAAVRQPEGWPGWPGGKKFALVLTHDIEGPKGLAKCLPLMNLDRKCGFRSSFNFTPDGTYQVPAELRRAIEQNGFEVGIHDLQHDGKLFRSQRDFSRKAERINAYIREWGASGFRSAFMLRNLDWMHQLDVDYDSSTFDTDPFEMQSNGTGTLFPFWIPAPAGSGAAPARDGYVEMPYTLPQDSTLFLVLGETSPDIWIRKLDWIAGHGGMALLNVHPDYVQFEGQPPSRKTYPVEHYTCLLEHVRRRYEGSYWQPTPRELAAFVAGIRPRPLAYRSKRVGMITHSFYENDNRVTRYAEALAERGDRVDVVSLRRSAATPREETIKGVRVFRIQDRFGKTEQSMLAYLKPLLRFLLVSSWWLTRRHARERYDILHVHNMPDFLVFAGWYPRMTGTPIILDIHDLVPEFFAGKFGAGKSLRVVNALKWTERRSAGFASHVIMSNHLWLGKFTARTGTGDRCSVFINNVDTRTFQPQERIRNDGKIIVLFPGGLQWHQGLDIALRAFIKVRAELPNAEFHIYGDGNMKPTLVALAGELGLNGTVRFFEPVTIAEIARVMANADLGVVPKRADSFGNEAYSTKIMEFMSLGVPVVASRTKIDQYYFNDSVLRFFESGKSDALAEAILEVLRDAGLRHRMISHALEYSAKNSWGSRKADYLKIVDELTGPS